MLSGMVAATFATGFTVASGRSGRTAAMLIGDLRAPPARRGSQPELEAVVGERVDERRRRG